MSSGHMPKYSVILDIIKKEMGRRMQEAHREPTHDEAKRLLMAPSPRLGTDRTEGG